MYEVFETLLNSRGITIYKFCKDTGISESTIYTWKKTNHKCGAKVLKAVCDYFDVSADFIMNGEQRSGETAYYLNDETAAIAQSIFENKELRLLFDAAKDAPPEDLSTVHAMLLALKRKEQGNID